MMRKTERINLTPDRIRKLPPPDGKQAIYIYDKTPPQLCVRITPAGAKSFVFASKLHGAPLRITIGSSDSWAVEDARNEARRLQVLIDQGKDPRKIAAEQIALANVEREAKAAALQAEQQDQLRKQIKVSEVWGVYVESRTPKWSERTRLDHLKIVQQSSTKGVGKSQRTLKAGVMAAIADLPLSAVTPETVSKWLEVERSTRGTQAALAFRMLRAFLNWCEDRPEFRGIAPADACSRRVSREHVKKSRAKVDALQQEQLKPWFSAVVGIPNVTISTYLQGLLITGARRNELSGLRWVDVDFEWGSLTIRDKAESKGGENGTRTIPLTPYFASLLRVLKQKNETPPSERRLKTLKARGEEWSPSEWVFSSPTSKSGKLEEPGIAHREVLAAAKLPPISLHGLRRSFGSLSEWCECPIGVVAQIQGHKPSATAEKHYRVRPIDLLRKWHTTIEDWIIQQASVQVNPAPKKSQAEAFAAYSSKI